MASIIFDSNEPIETNQLAYLIDSEAPVLHLEFKDGFLWANAIDNDSGLNHAFIYDKETLVLELNESQPRSRLELKPRKEAYLIYASAVDNVGNQSPNKFYLNVTVAKEEKSFKCLNDCSNNGNCNSKYGICECEDEYTGLDCSKALSKAELFMRPLDYSVSYYESDRRNEINLNLNFQNETYDMLLIEISTLVSQESMSKSLNNVEFIFNNHTYADCLRVNTTERLTDFGISLKFKKSQNTMITFNLTTFRFDHDTNDTVTNSHLNEYEFDLKPFMSDRLLDVDDSACYDFDDGKINRIKVFAEELEETDTFYVDRVSHSFIQLKKEQNFIIVHSTELFDQVNLTVGFLVEFTNSFFYFISFFF